MEKISVALITKNEQEDIKDCLGSIEGLGEIVIIDSYSTDETLSIARKYTENVYSRDFDDFSSQKNYAIEKAAGDWVLFLDADERVSSELKDEILKTISIGGYDGYYIPRKNYIFGRLMRYGGHQNDKQLRLFKKEKSKFVNPIHEKVLVNGKTGLLKNAIEHYSTRTLSEYMKKLNLYTDLEAKFAKEMSYKIKPHHIIIRPVLKFVHQYFLKGGFKDGMEGFIFYALSSFYLSVKYIKCWESK